MTSKQKLLRLRDEVIAERIEQRKDKIRLIEKHNERFLPDTGIFLLSDIEITGNKW